MTLKHAEIIAFPSCELQAAFGNIVTLGVLK